MKKTTSTGALRFALFAAAGAAACAWAPHAAADDAVPLTDLGTQADVGGGQQWMVTGLQPSADQIAAAPAGSLWEATATATPAQGGIPIVPGFAARTPGGEDYPVLWNVPTPLGINPSPLPTGESATGKLYFDVTGAAPDSVTYTRDGHDLAVWVQPPPPPADAPAPLTYGGGMSTYAPPVQAAPAPAPVPSAAAPAPAAPAPAATGSSGTPAPAAAGTPAPATPGSSGTPQPATGSVGTPATPGATAATPAPTTPAPAGATPAPSTQPSSSPAAGTAPAGGTPAPAATPTTPPASTPLPTTGSSGTTFTVPMTTPVPAPAG